MTTFKVRDKETGRVFTVREKIDSGKKSIVNDFLPGKDRVEELVSQRENPIESIRKELQTPFNLSPSAFIGLKGPKESPGFKALITGAKAVGSGIGLIEGGVSNVLQSFQEGDFKAKTLMHEFLSGVTGKKPGELGDLVRSTGFGGKANEALANVTGFMGIVGSTNLLSRNRIVQGARKISKALKARSASRATDKRFFFKNRADQLADGANDILTNVRQEFDELYKRIGNDKIGANDVDIIKEAKELLSSSEIRRFSRELKINPDDLVNKIDDLNKVKVLKGIIGRSVPKKIWSGIDQATPKHTELINKYHELNDVIAKNSGAEKETLLALNKRYKEVLDMRKIIFKITKEQSTGITKTGTLKNIRSFSNQGNLSELERFSGKDFFPKTKNIIRDIDNFNRNQNIKKGLKTAAKVGVGFEILRRFGSQPVDALLPE